MPDKLTLVENFDGMNFLNSPRICECDQFLKIETDSVNANAIAVFMILVVLAMSATAFFLDGGKSAAFVLVGGTMAGSMLVGMFYLIAANDRNRVLPHIEKSQARLVLASGTVIPKRSIECFRQYSCNTKMSNFRLVLTTVVTQGPNVPLEYAVAPVIGKFSEDCIGATLAREFDAQLIQDNNRTFTANELAELGLS